MSSLSTVGSDTFGATAGRGVFRLMPKSAAKASLNASDGFLALDASPCWTRYSGWIWRVRA